MELKVSGGGGTNANKSTFFMGMLFVVLGALIGLPWLVIPILTGAPIFGFGGLLFAAIFCGVGGFFAYIGRQGMTEGKEILEEGTAYMGKIFAYEEDRRITMNGQAPIVLVIRYLKKGEIAEARVNTGDINKAAFPIGATVSFKMLNGLAALVPGSISDIMLEREDDLMNPDFDATRKASSINVECPNCGANVAVPLGMSRYCPYCETKLSLSRDGELMEAR